MNKVSLIKRINETEKSMGFMSFSEEESSIFPSTKIKVKVLSPLLEKQIICTFDPKYNRIYGLRKLFLKSPNNNLFKIKSNKKNNYIITL